MYAELDKPVQNCARGMLKPTNGYSPSAKKTIKGVMPPPPPLRQVSLLHLWNLRFQGSLPQNSGAAITGSSKGAGAGARAVAGAGAV